MLLEDSQDDDDDDIIKFEGSSGSLEERMPTDNRHGIDDNEDNDNTGDCSNSNSMTYKSSNKKKAGTYIRIHVYTN